MFIHLLGTLKNMKHTPLFLFYMFPIKKIQTCHFTNIKAEYLKQSWEVQWGQKKYIFELLQWKIWHTAGVDGKHTLTIPQKEETHTSETMKIGSVP